MSKLIILDPGHGGSDPGAVNGNRYEKDDVLRLSQAVEKKLRSQSGCQVAQTRSSDSFVMLVERTNMANKLGADLFVSLHRDSFDTAAANGVTVFVHPTAKEADVEAATAVLARIADTGVQTNRGVKQYNFHVLRESNVTSMLVELGFISNAKDNELFDKHFDNYAAAIAQGICQSVGIEYNPKSQVLYRIQVGDFKNRQNAEGFLTQVKGLSAFVIECADGLYRVQVGAFAIKANAEAYLKQVKTLGLEAFLVEAE